MSNNLLKEAVADAKQVRETAIANAKLALEEAFAPKIQSMISSKLAEEMEEDDEEPVADTPEMEPAMDMEPSDAELDAEDEAELDAEEEIEAEDEVEEEMEEEMEEEEDLELEAIIKELEDEVEESEHTSEEMEEGEYPDEDMEEDYMEEIDLEEVIRSLSEELEEGEMEEEDKVAEMEDELEEAYNVIKLMRAKINEVNLLNSKLLYTNKLFKNPALSESARMKVLESFDRATSVREVKLVYTTLAESLRSKSAKRVTEGIASKATPSTAPSKIITETTDFASRMKKLANL